MKEETDWIIDYARKIGSVVSERDHRLLMTDHWSLITDHWSLITDYRSLITDY